jgi:hypothetical protein
MLFAFLAHSAHGGGQPAAASRPCTKTDLVGSWKLTLSEDKPPTGGETAYKHVTPTHFFVLSTDAEGLASYAHGGPYTLTGGAYAESTTHGFGPAFAALRGMTLQMQCRMDGERWHVVGNVPNVGSWDEVWTRMTAADK